MSSNKKINKEPIRVCAVVVNFRTSRMAMETIKALYLEIVDFVGSQIVVVDNDSRDGSLELLKEFIEDNKWEEIVQIVDAGRNGGFGAGNNFAIRQALTWNEPPDYFYLINPDALPVKGSVRLLVNFLEDNLCSGIVGGTIKRPNGSQQVSSFNFPNIVDEFCKGLSVGFIRKLLINYVVAPEILKETRKVDWVSGACILVRSEMLKEIGLFDESFFLYYEEIDLCRRARKADWDVVHVVDGGIVHICGVATGITETQKRTPEYLFHSRKYYFRKHYGLCYLWLTNIVFTLAYCISYPKKIIQQKTDQERPFFLWDFVRKSF